ncbi:putative polyprotein, partial [Tanacetum coccineum]
KRIQREAHTYPINVDTAHALERIAATMETAAIKNAVSALTEPEDCYKKPKSSSICSDTQSEESDDANITVDPGWDDFCLTSAKLPRMEAHRLGKKTRKEVLELVEEISQQPKKVEEEALKLTAELERKVKRIEEQVHRIEHLVKEVQQFLTT